MNRPMVIPFGRLEVYKSKSGLLILSCSVLLATLVLSGCSAEKSVSKAISVNPTNASIKNDAAAQNNNSPSTTATTTIDSSSSTATSNATNESGAIKSAPATGEGEDGSDKVKKWSSVKDLQDRKRAQPKSTALEEEKTLFAVEKKAFDQNRYLDKIEAQQVTDRMENIAANSDPGTADKIRQIADAARAYRAKLDEFQDLGGAKIETIKSMKDLDHRLSMIDELSILSDRLNYVCKNNGGDTAVTPTFNLERRLLSKIREQLLFYKMHYGKWEIPASGPVRFNVSQRELDDFIALSIEIKALGEEQMRLMKTNANAHIDKLNSR